MRERDSSRSMARARRRSARSAMLRWIFTLATPTVLVSGLAKTSGAQSQSKVPKSVPAGATTSPRVAASKAATARNASLTRAKAVANYTSLPLRFEANRGQTDPRVKFLSHGQGYTLFLTQQEAVLSVIVPEKNATPAQIANTNSAIGASHQAAALRVKFFGATDATMVAGKELLRSQTNYFLGNDPKQWHTGVPNYAAVEYHGLYPGIDAVFHGNRQQFEFDFDVAPGADPSRTELEIEGSAKPLVNAQGNIVLSVADQTEVTLGKPRIYQEIAGQRREVAGNFVVRDGNRVGFSVGDYDRSLPLVIDPTFNLAYSTYIGGNGVDTVSGVAEGFSPSGTDLGTYLVGTTDSSIFPATTPQIPTTTAFQSTCQACAVASSSAFVAMFDTSQNLVYYTYLGPYANPPVSGPYGEIGSASGNAIAVDSSGNAYITGQTNSAYFPYGSPPSTTSPLTYPGGPFVSELSSDGTTLLNSTSVGGGTKDSGNGIALDGQGNVYVVGTTETSGLATAGAVQTTSYGSGPFVAELNFSNTNPSKPSYYTYLLGTSLLGSSGDVGSAIAVDPASGNVFVGGTTLNPNPPLGANTITGLATYRPNSSYEWAGFVAELNPTTSPSSLLYFSYLWGPDTHNPVGSIYVIDGTQVMALGIDSGDNIYVTGRTDEPDLPTTPRAVGGATSVCEIETVGTVSGLTECPRGFVAEFNPNVSGAQSLETVSYFGGITPDPASFSAGTVGNIGTVGNAIAVDQGGDIFVTGGVTTSDFPETGQSPAAGAIEGSLPCGTAPCEAGYLVEFSPSAIDIYYSTYFGVGNGTDYGTGIALDSNSNVYLVGKQNSSTATIPQFPGFAAPLIANPPSPGSGFFSVLNVSSGTPLISFSPAAANLSSTNTTIQLTVTNTGNSSLDLISWAAYSPTSPNPFSIASPPCGVNQASSLPPGSSCTLTISFTPPAVAGQYSGTIIFADTAPQGVSIGQGNYEQTYYLEGSSTGSGALATPTIAKAFNPTSIQSGGTSTVTLTLSNSNTSALTGGSFADTLANMSAVGGTGAVTGTCAGTAPSTLAAGATALSFTGITIPASGSCTVIFSVTSSTVGAWPNATSGVTTTQTPTAGATSNTATLTVTALATPTIAKAFNPTSIQSGGTSTVTLTLSNSNTSALTGGSFTDTLANMSAVGGAVTGTCAGTAPSTLAAGATALSFTGITIPASGSCTVIFSVTSSTVGAWPNATSGVTTTQTPTAGATSNTATLTVTIPPPPPPANATATYITTPINFGNVASGSTATQYLYVFNYSSSTSSFTVTSATISVTNSPFTFIGVTSACTGSATSSSATGLPLTLAPGQGCRLSLQYAPTATEFDSANLQIVDNAESSNLANVSTTGGIQRNVALFGDSPVSVGTGQLTTIAGSTAAPGGTCGYANFSLPNSFIADPQCTQQPGEITGPTCSSFVGPVPLCNNGYSGDGGLAITPTYALLGQPPYPLLHNPYAVGAGPDGTVYIADYFNSAVRAVSPTSGDIATVGTTTGNATAVAADGVGNVYFGDNQGNVYVLSNGTVSTFTSFTGGQWVNALTTDSNNNLYAFVVPGFGSGTESPEIVEYCTASSTNNNSCFGGPQRIVTNQIRVSGPIYGLAADSQGNVYSYAGNGTNAGQIIELQFSGSTIIPISPAPSTPGAVSGGGIEGLPSSSLTLDSNGNFYILNGNGNLLEEYTPTGPLANATGTLTILAGTGSNGYNVPNNPYPPFTALTDYFDNGPFSAAQTDLNGAEGIAVDKNGVIYIADTSNNLVREIANTPAINSPVSVTPVDTTTGTSPITITFSGIMTGGQTTLTESPTGPTGTAPTGYQFDPNNPPVFLYISTTASVTPPVTICLNLGLLNVTYPPIPSLVHYMNGVPSTPYALTLNTSTGEYCASGIPSLSPFVLVKALAPITPQVNWTTPAAITYGTALSATQLDATVSPNINGTFAYAPPAGTVLSGGTQSLSVTFTPQDTTDYTSATGGTTLTVNPAGTSVRLGTSANGAVADGTAVTLTGTVVSAVAGTPAGPTGTLTFLNGTTSLGAGALSQGVATLTVSTLPSGNNSITASYGGDMNFTGSTSPVETVAVNSPDYTVSASPSSLTLAAGQSGSTTITVTPEGYSGTVTFSCGSLPSYITCAFNPSSGSVTFASGATAAQTVTLSVAVASTVSRLEGQHRELLFALALPLGLFCLLPMSGRYGRRLRLLVLLVALTVGLGGAVAGCGSSTSSTASTLPPAGQQTVTVTAAGSGSISHQLQLTITITN